MSAISAPAPTGAPAKRPRKRGMSTAKKIGLAIAGGWFILLILSIIAFGFKSHKVHDVADGYFSPTFPFKLDTWFNVGPVDFNKGVLYVVLTSVITLVLMLYVARRLKQRPGRLQTAIEMFYSLSQSMTRENLDEKLSKRYFPVVATLFMYILVTNIIAYLPLPVDSMDKFSALGTQIPSFQIYAADTNLAFPLILSLMVFALFTWEGLKAHHGPIGLLKSLIPGGLSPAMTPMLLVIEVLSYFLRLVSLCVRLWANLLAGHMLIEFMAGELGVLVGSVWVIWLLLPFGVAIYAFEVILIGTLQAFIFAILTAIYIGITVQSH